jgi:hypothetical protein
MSRNSFQKLQSYMGFKQGNHDQETLKIWFLINSLQLFCIHGLKFYTFLFLDYVSEPLTLNKCK